MLHNCAEIQAFETVQPRKRISNSDCGLKNIPAIDLPSKKNHNLYLRNLVLHLNPCFMNLRNKSFFLFLFLSVACHHKDLPPKPPIWEVSTQSVEVQGRAVLEYPLPDPFQKVEPIISSRPENASLAEIFKNADGRWAVRYQSLSGLPGSDKMRIDSEADHHEGHQGCHGESDRPDHDDDGHEHHPHEQKVFHRLNLEISILSETENQKKKESSLLNGN